MTIAIRRGTDADAAAFRALRLQALRDHPEAYSADYEVTAAWPMDAWLDRLRASPIYFAADGDGLVGIAGIYPGNTLKTKHRGTLWGVYVRPEYRGRGLAGQLVQTCVDWAVQQSLRLVTRLNPPQAIVSLEQVDRRFFSAGFSPSLDPMLTSLFADRHLNNASKGNAEMNRKESPEPNTFKTGSKRNRLFSGCHI